MQSLKEDEHALAVLGSDADPIIADREQPRAILALRPDVLVLDLLEWLTIRDRSYEETMDAWRTSCPRLTIWEDAMSAGLIERLPGSSLADATVHVTEAGRTWLRRGAAPPAQAGPQYVAQRPGVANSRRCPSGSRT